MASNRTALLAALITGLARLPGGTSAAVAADHLIVCPDCAIRTLSEAIAVVDPGGLVEVRGGTYLESGLRILKPLRLVGIGRPVIDAGGKGSVLVVQAPSVEISGFEIRNSGVENLEDLAGIRVVETFGCRIVDNDLRDNHFGIHVAKSRNCLIERNRIRGSHKNRNAIGNGIHIWYGEHMVLLDNEVTGGRDGIYFEFVKSSRIIRNRSFGNMRYGLHFMFSNDDEYRENVFARNESGVAVMYSSNIRMIGNRFEASLGARLTAPF